MLQDVLIYILEILNTLQDNNWWDQLHCGLYLTIFLSMVHPDPPYSATYLQYVIVIYSG